MIEFLLEEPRATLLALFAIVSIVFGAVYRFIIWSPPISMSSQIMIGRLNFIEVGPESPEQYEVYDGDQQVGYVRYRFGFLSAECPDAGMREVFSRKLKHNTGQMTDIERGRWLPVIARRIKRHIRRGF